MHRLLSINYPDAPAETIERPAQVRGTGRRCACARASLADAYAVVVDDSRAADEFRRIELVSLLERERAIVGQYEQHLAFYRARIEDRRYELGRLDERLGGGNDDGA